VSSPRRVWDGAPAAIAFSACFRQQNASGRKKNTILLPLVRVSENQIQALSRTFRHKFKDFQGPCLFSKTFKALKIWKNYSRTFKDPQEPCVYTTSGHIFSTNVTNKFHTVKCKQLFHNIKHCALKLITSFSSVILQKQNRHQPELN